MYDEDYKPGYKTAFKMNLFRFKKARSALVLLVVSAVVIYISRGRADTPRPNVILVVCETLRSDHLGCYGYRRDTSKNIDSFANNAFIFKNAHSQAPCTRPSVWDIMTSRYQSKMPAKDEYVTMAEYFKSNNYRTAAFIAHGALRPEESNLQQGFDVYNWGDKQRKANSMTNAAIKWIGQDKKKPFFVWLFYFEPHNPYIPPDRFKGYYNKTEKFSGDRRTEDIGFKGKNNHLVTEEHKQFLINAYDEEIRYFDYEIGRLFSYLKRSGLYDDSIIILTADHGEELGDNGNRWDHCQLLSQEEIWVPLLIKLPGNRKKRVIEENVQNIDIYPTLVEFLDKPRLPRYFNKLEGKSLTPLLTGEGLNDNRYAASFWKGQRCIIMDGYKYWQWGNKEYLIDVKTRKRITDLAIRDKLKNQLDKICKQYLMKEKYYKKTVKDLRSLGYLQ